LIKEKAGRNIYDISVACNEEALVETLKESNKFFDEQNIDEKTGMRVRLCVEELMKNIIEFARKDTNKQYLDLKIVVNDENICAIIKDDGAQFNPITAEAKGFGLKIIQGLCPKLEYQYSYGQNMVFMTWDK
jgi:anti-sigma regulatory factor (Ser/Thr protein kinase)